MKTSPFLKLSTGRWRHEARRPVSEKINIDIAAALTRGQNTLITSWQMTLPVIMMTSKTFKNLPLPHRAGVPQAEDMVYINNGVASLLD